MQELSPWLTPALLVALVAWLRPDIRELRRDLNGWVDTLTKDVNKRFDDVVRELADQRKRMAKLEGFLAGRRGPDAA